MAPPNAVRSLISLAMLSWLAGCGDAPIGSESRGRRPGTLLEPTTVTVASSRGGPTDAIPLEVTFDDAATGLRSDGAGAYRHGVDRVEAVLRANGNLNFDAASLTGKQQPIRLVRVRVTDHNTASVVYDGIVDLFMSTHPRLADDVVLRQMSVGQSGPVTGTARWPSADSTYILHFGRNCAGDTVIAGNRMFATHPAADTWTLTAERGHLCRQADKGTSPIITVTERASAAFFLNLRALSP